MEIKKTKEKGLKKYLLSVFAMAVALSFMAIPANAQETEIQIVHTNDFHGYYQNKDGSETIGFAYLKAIIDKEQPELVLDAGDTYHGQAFATVSQGKSMAQLMKAVGYDAMTPGNHDWSYGAERLKTLEQEQGFPILASNITNASGEAYFDTPYLIKEVTVSGATLKIGVIGVIDDTFYSSTVPENVAGLAFQEEAASANSTAETLRENGCDMVIVLTHQADCEGFVKKLRGIDAVIAGHDHRLLDETYKDLDGKEVPLVEAGYYFNDVGVLSLTYDDAQEKIVHVEEAVYTAESEELKALIPDPDIAAKITEIEEEEKPILSEVLGQSSEAYPYSWEEVRCKEQAIGRIITAAYLDKTGADVAMENAGGIRAGIPKGDITYQNLISISPYGNTLLTKKMTGKQILNVIEDSLTRMENCDKAYTLQKEAEKKGQDPYQYEFPKDSGSVLQFGGIEVKYDDTKTPGNQIISAKIKGEAINSDREYTVAMNNYIASNYEGISTAAALKEYGTCEEALKSYIQKGNFAQAAKTENLSKATAQTPGPIDTSQAPDPTDTSATTQQQSQTSSESLSELKAGTDASGKPVIQWKKVSDASGYQIYRSGKKNGTYQKVKKITKNSVVSWIDKKAETGKTYYYKMRSYKTVSGKKTYSGYTGKEKATAIPATPDFQLKKRSGQIEIRIQSNEKRSGWQVEKQNVSGTFQQIVKEVKQAESTTIKVQKGKKYHFTIRSYQVIHGKKVYSKWAAVKTI